MEMNTPIAIRQAGGSSENRSEESRSASQELATAAKTNPRTDLSRRVPLTTPRPSDLLERVEGVARWGLNE